MMANPLAPEEIRENIALIRDRLEKAARSAGREPGEVRLMAVTKTVQPELVNVAAEEGIRLFGENRAQELLEKADSYRFGPDQIHFIGTLQTNKVRQIIDRVCCIQSVNSIHLAREIQKRAAAAGKTMDVLVEVNIGEESSKTGADQKQILEILEEVEQPQEEPVQEEAPEQAEESAADTVEDAASAKEEVIPWNSEE